MTATAPDDQGGRTLLEDIVGRRPHTPYFTVIPGIEVLSVGPLNIHVSSSLVSQANIMRQPPRICA